MLQPYLKSRNLLRSQGLVNALFSPASQFMHNTNLATSHDNTISHRDSRLKKSVTPRTKSASLESVLGSAHSNHGEREHKSPRQPQPWLPLQQHPPPPLPPRRRSPRRRIRPFRVLPNPLPPRHLALLQPRSQIHKPPMARCPSHVHPASHPQFH